MRTFNLFEEALLNSCLDEMKSELVKRAGSLVTDTGVALRGEDFGKRQMSYMLSVASEEPEPEVVIAWMKGQIGKARESDPWRGGFGERAIKEVGEVQKIAAQALSRQAWPDNRIDYPHSSDTAVRELWHRGIALFFGYAGWDLLFEFA